jgi:hypothetical protein
LEKSDRSVPRVSDEDHRIIVLQPFADEKAGPFQVGGLAVELAIEVKKDGDRFEERGGGLEEVEVFEGHLGLFETEFKSLSPERGQDKRDIYFNFILDGDFCPTAFGGAEPWGSNPPTQH